MTIQTKLTIIAIAKLTATIEGGGFKRTATKDKAIEKFVKAAKGAGLESEAIVLVLSGFSAYDPAASTLKAILKGAAEPDKATEAPDAPEAPVAPAPASPAAPKTKRVSDLDKVITVIENGRREGSFAHTTLCTITKHAEKGDPVTVREFIAMGGLRINLRYDIKKGFVKVADAAK